VVAGPGPDYARVVGVSGLRAMRKKEKGGVLMDDVKKQHGQSDGAMPERTPLNPPKPDPQNLRLANRHTKY
jgi:hypothetical protein